MVAMIRSINGSTSMMLVSSNSVIDHMLDGWDYMNDKGIPSPSKMNTLDNNSVRMNGMIYFTNILRTSDVIDLDDLVDVPSYIFN